MRGARSHKSAIAALCRTGLVAWLLAFAGSAALAQAHLCDQAAADAAARHDVPAAYLAAITRVETGRTQGGVMAPWPWTLNVGGDGQWHDTRGAALDALSAAVRTGRRNIDVGCFQINHRWHRDAFSDLEDMLDPTQNADYAARFLRRLHGEFGTWEGAVAAYHSRNAQFADVYIARFRTVLAGLQDAPAPLNADEPPRLAVGPRPLDTGRRQPLIAQLGPHRGWFPAARPLLSQGTP